MTGFSFLHAADLHLDSPLIGLAGRSPDFAERVENASRAALDALVELAIAEDCRFVLLAGDVFDGDLRNIRAGLYFVSRMRRLAEAGVPVVVILGNHDAENRFMSRLELSDNVRLISARKPETVRIDGLDVAIHGRSFPQRDVTENLARAYPPPVPGCFNIGLLHTALIGHEGEHAAYAPCSLEQLRLHGYDYWALGHVHDRQVLSERPHVVYPGNLQGRSVRETGAKGASLVRVLDGEVTAVEHRALDAVRWDSAVVRLDGVADRPAALDRIRAAMVEALDKAGGRPLALRLRLTGETPLAGAFALGRGELRDDVETLAAGLSGDLWLEKLSLGLTPPSARSPSLDPTVAGRLDAEITAIADDASFAARRDARLAEVLAKLPQSARAAEFAAQIRAEAGARAATLARALVEGDDAL
ncbi:metallophosphoesterase family protein [Methylopila turkensis]|uniref:Metallophosphoesterase n=1 Tax=Methylopila turkensis TaxID=1437816 RepID=A0A9W6JPS1_9HYPH|nr:DNA repair exonuclease [Methylopila turkensis]GLK81510.1 metallophosphoesterase [Methylopila turkensis]